MENNKYYTPTSIDEFFVGLEYEWKSEENNRYHSKYNTPSKEWTSDIFNGRYDEMDGSEVDSLMKFFDGNSKIEIRIPYLNKESITALGWKPQTVLHAFEEQFTATEHKFIEGYTINKNSNETFILHLQQKSTNRYVIYKQTEYNQHSGNWEQELLFVGILKNQGELMKVMKQMDYE